MYLSYAGFNLYGQVHESDKEVIAKFHEFGYKCLKRLILTYSQAIIENGDGLFLYGFFDGKTHQIKEIPSKEGEIIKKVVANDVKAVILYESGELGEVNLENLRLNVKNYSLSTEEFITDIACGSDIFIAVTNKGNIYQNDTKLEFATKNIMQVTAGREHCLLLDTDGNVYSFGTGRRGQLGHGDLENLEKPTQIDALAGIRIKKIATGGWHSCALSETGDLYTWGWNSHGQLALSNEYSVIATPQAVDFPDFEEIVTNVACGTKHTVALAGRNLYGTGWNKYSQLGMDLSTQENKMRCLYNFKKEIVDLVCGPWGTAVICTD